MLAELRIQGFKPRQLVGLLLFQALVLGVVASLVGLLVGSVLSRSVFDASPDYLSPAFTLGTSTVVGARPIALALGGGIARQLPGGRAAAARPAPRAGASTPSSTRAASPATRSSRARAGSCSRVALVLIALATAVLLLAPSATLVGVRAARARDRRSRSRRRSRRRAARRSADGALRRLNMLSVALLGAARDDRALARARRDGRGRGLRQRRDRRARNDLLNGIAALHRRLRRRRPTCGSSTRSTTRRRTTSLGAGDAPRASAAVPGVAAVRALPRRLPRLRRPARVGDRALAGRPALLPASQLVRGELARGDARLREGGWVVLSDQIARAHARRARRHDRASDADRRRARFRVAATTTNLGWSPGAMIIGAADYRRAWATRDADRARGRPRARRRPRGRPARRRCRRSPAGRRRAARADGAERAARDRRLGAPGARTPRADLGAAAGRRGARDGGRDGRGDLAAARVARGAADPGLQSAAAVARAAAGDERRARAPAA